ncbi:MAG TPA: hypothetical protein VFU78_19225 [Thermomicrobiales bacterium]|jgi:hypothetical protein|nr:hypothetical protein [Thermomicrobiales bacterium]
MARRTLACRLCSLCVVILVMACGHTATPVARVSERPPIVPASPAAPATPQPATRLTDALPFPEYPEARIIARVLHGDPLIIEVFEERPRWSDNEMTFGVRSQLFVVRSEAPKLATLRFGELITARLYRFEYDAGELALGEAITDIAPVVGAVQYADPPAPPFNNRSGTLIKYVPLPTNTSGYLLIFNDGHTIYRDRYGDSCPDMQLDRHALDALRAVFAQARFNDLASDYTVSDYDSSLLLIADRYQAVRLTADLRAVEPVTAALDTLIANCRSRATSTITYMARLTVRDWAYASLITPDSVYNTRLSPDRKAALAQVTPTPEFREELQHSVYRYKGKLYGVGFGSCSDGTAGTWGCFDAVEYVFGAHGPRRYWLWPQNLGIHLWDVPPGGLDLPAAEYPAHQSFYDTLFASEDSVYYLEGEFLYQRVIVHQH